MINVEELRIGNLIYDDKLSITIVNRIEYIEKSVFIINGKLSDKFSPIDISKDWMLKLGFEDDGLNKNGFRLCYENNDERLKVLFILMDDNDNWGIMNRYVNKKTEFSQDSYPIFPHPQYIHQIQNIHFILTGKELSYP